MPLAACGPLSAIVAAPLGSSSGRSSARPGSAPVSAVPMPAAICACVSATVHSRTSSIPPSNAAVEDVTREGGGAT